MRLLSSPHSHFPLHARRHVSSRTARILRPSTRRCQSRWHCHCRPRIRLRRHRCYHQCVPYACTWGCCHCVNMIRWYVDDSVCVCAGTCQLCPPGTVYHSVRLSVRNYLSLPPRSSVPSSVAVAAGYQIMHARLELSPSHLDQPRANFWPPL